MKDRRPAACELTVGHVFFPLHAHLALRHERRWSSSLSLRAGVREDHAGSGYE